MQSANSKVQVQDFTFISVIGKGSFAKVHLVRKKTTGKIMAMKVLKKKYVIDKKVDNFVTAENSILRMMDHPFIVKLFYAFQNEKKLYFVLEYCSGGELFGVLSKNYPIKEEM